MEFIGSRLGPWHGWPWPWAHPCLQVARSQAERHALRPRWSGDCQRSGDVRERSGNASRGTPRHSGDAIPASCDVRERSSGGGSRAPTAVACSRRREVARRHAAMHERWRGRGACELATGDVVGQVGEKERLEREARVTLFVILVID